MADAPGALHLSIVANSITLLLAHPMTIGIVEQT
jgi:hypothetical protein